MASQYLPVAPEPDDGVEPCRISGWMPWLPPTPGPSSMVRLRDADGRIDRGPSRTVNSGSHDIRHAPVRRVVSELPGRVPGGEHVYTLECRHKAYRKLRMSYTRCAECPRVKTGDRPR